ncbi:MAG: hypothetical protein ACOCWV_02935 [Planctomycetota bacterium]
MSAENTLPHDDDDFDAPDLLPIQRDDPDDFDDDEIDDELDEYDELDLFDEDEDEDEDEGELDGEEDEDDEEYEIIEIELEEADVDELKEMYGYRLAYELIESEAEGLYEEMDKLCRLAPKERATKLQMQAVNKAIQRAKVLLEGDAIIDEIAEFAIRRELPEYRDAVTVLRQVLQAMKRYAEGSSAYLWSPQFEAQIEAAGINEEDAGDPLAEV